MREYLWPMIFSQSSWQRRATGNERWSRWVLASSARLFVNRALISRKKPAQNPCKDLGDKAKQMHQISPDMLETPILSSPFQITWNVDSTRIATAPWFPPGEFKSQSPECSWHQSGQSQQPQVFCVGVSEKMWNRHEVHNCTTMHGLAFCPWCSCTFKAWGSEQSEVDSTNANGFMTTPHPSRRASKKTHTVCIMWQSQ